MTLHPGSALGVPHFQLRVGAEAVIFGEGLTGCGSAISLRTAGQEFFAKFGEVGIPAELHSEFGGCAFFTVGGVHELDVLHMLFRGAVDDGGNGFGNMIVGHELELVEAGEEMIVARLVSGAPVAHGPGTSTICP